MGFKSTLLDGRATLNLAAYQTVVEDYQANVVSSLETAAIRSYPSNVPEVRVQGVEVDFAALLFEGFTLRASVAYADGENTDYPAGPVPARGADRRHRGLRSHRRAAGGPVRAVWDAGLRLPKTDGRAASFAAPLDTNSRDGYNSDTSASQYTWIDGYSVTNASVGYRFAEGWEIEVFARNLFDEEYITALTIQTGNSGLILGQPGEPRTVGVAFRFATR